ncbi:MAG: RepB family DNA primase [Deltaproteobacteria bacterium]|nr:RepB family DNA primase [Deltaproteobacteria bacterium]
MTHQSIEQLKLYPPETKFTLKAKNFETGEIKIIKNQMAEAYPKSLSYLKYLNTNGYNIFLSPSVAGGVYILLDDIKKPEIERLYKDGFEPFYYLETSPANYQAIIKLSDNQLSKEIWAFISKQLSEIYFADKNSSDTGHFFRLAGFTNRKDKYCQDGLYPFVKFYAGSGKSCTKGQEYIDRIIKGIESGLIELELSKKHSEIDTPPATLEKNKNKSNCFQYIAKIYQTSNLSDLSAVDFKAVKYALKKGFDITDIKESIRQFSPNIENRKKGHIDDYLSRTINNAMLR